MNIVVYADDSGTHSLNAKEKGSNIAVLAGYAGLADDWVNFCGRWQTTLNEYKVRIFHFSEFADMTNGPKKPNWPYKGWSKEKRHEFLFKLASIAGSRARFPFASSFRLAKFHSDPDIKRELKEKGLDDRQINGPHLVYLGLFADFFEIFLKELEVYHPKFDGTVSLVFDDKEKDAYWRVATHNMYDHYKKIDSRLEPPQFGNTLDNVPLQAADMVAYRIHQIWENEHKTNRSQVFSVLDYTLWGNFKGSDDFRVHIKNLLGRDLPELKDEDHAKPNKRNVV